MDLFSPLEAPVSFPDSDAAARALEACETPRWAALAGLACGGLGVRIIDPCVGRGALADVALSAGHDVRACDIYPWEYDGPRLICDFLSPGADELVTGWKPGSFDCFMNPPFSKACAFVDRAIGLGAGKVVSFQRLAWLESQDRRAWWDCAPCRRVILMGDRATWWYFHIPLSKRKGNNPTAHAWFEFVPGHVGPPVIERFYKQDIRP